MNKTNDISISKQAFRNSKVKFSALSYPLAYFALSAILSLIIEYVAPGSLILCAAFLILPSFFALTANNIIIEKQQNNESKAFFTMFRRYYSPLFMGGFKIISTYLISILVMLLSATVVSTVLSMSLMGRDLEFTALLANLVNLETTESINAALNEYFIENPMFSHIIFASYAVGNIAAFYTFVHRSGMQTFKHMFSFFSKVPYPMAGLNVVHKNFMRENKRKVLKDYFKATWFLTLLFFVLMTGISTALYLFIDDFNIDQIIIIATAGTFIVLLGFIPYYINVIELIFIKYRNEYQTNFLKVFKDTLDRISKDKRLTPEEKSTIVDTMSKEQEELNNIDKDSE